MLGHLEHLDHLDRDTRRLVDLVELGDLNAPVLTCGDWIMSDLAWHVCEVQHFWNWVVGTRASDPSAYPEPSRPADRELAAALDEGRLQLVATLRATDPSTPCWSWSGDQTAGFTHRRQSHEALVHRIDAEMALGEASAVDAGLAADGVDEVLGVFAAGVPEWATFTPEPVTVQLDCSDVPGSWTYRFGRMRGTSPRSGREHDLDAIAPDEPGRATCRIRATAAELDLWLWGRDRGDGLRIDGDPDVPRRLRALVADATR